MTIVLVAAFLLAFVLSLVLGKHLIPWLKKREFVQPLKDEVEQYIYRQG